MIKYPEIGLCPLMAELMPSSIQSNVCLGQKVKQHSFIVIYQVTHVTRFNREGCGYYFFGWLGGHLGHLKLSWKVIHVGIHSTAFPSPIITLVIWQPQWHLAEFAILARFCHRSNVWIPVNYLTRVWNSKRWNLVKSSAAKQLWISGKLVNPYHILINPYHILISCHIITLW